MANEKLDFSTDRPGIEITFPDKTSAILRRKIISGPNYPAWKQESKELEEVRIANTGKQEFDEHEHIRKQILFMGEGVSDEQLKPLDIMMLTAVITALSNLVTHETEEAKKNALGTGTKSSDSQPAVVQQ